MNDLLDRARIEAGTLELRREEVDARRLLHEVEELFRDTSETHTLEVQAPAEPVAVSCDPLRMEQVLTNLVSNATKYSPAGGLVTLRVDARDDEVVLSVRDEGVGIAPDEVAHVFEPFHRTHSLRDVPGAGLGLSVVRRIVESHGGFLRVVTAPGEGSTFEVHLRRDVA